MSLLFEDKVKVNRVAFVDRVKDIAARLLIPADWLMIVMNFETAGTFSPSVKNPHSSATGLIQFMEATARELGTSTAALASMSNVQQLDYVEKYMLSRKRQFGTFNGVEDVYLAVFYPAAIRKPLDWRFPDQVYRVNKVFDTQGKGYITKQDVQNKILSTVPANYREDLKKKSDEQKPDSHSCIPDTNRHLPGLHGPGLKNTDK